MMKFAAATAVIATGANAVAINRQPVIDAFSRNGDDSSMNARVNANDEFATFTGGNGEHSVRNAIFDCGGVGASATEKTRVLAAKIGKGYTGASDQKAGGANYIDTRVVRFRRHAAQDAGEGKSQRRNYPDPAVEAAYNTGIATYDETVGQK